MKLLDSSLKFIDIYGNNFNLLINKKTKIKTKLGGCFSIITFSLFILFFIQEFEEVLSKSNPFIFSYEFDEMSNNNSFSHKFPDIPFLIQIDKDTEETAKYITLEYSATIILRNSSFRYINNILDICTDDQIEKLKLIKNSNLKDNINFCPQNLNQEFYDEMKEFFIRIKIKKCSTSNCVYNQTFYDDLKDNPGYFTVSLKLFTSKKQLNNYRNPFDYFLSYENVFLGGEETNLVIKLSKQEIKTKGGFVLNENIEDKSFIIKSKEYDNFDYLMKNYLASFQIYFDFNVGIYNRTYKTFSSALAHCLSILKLLKFIFQYLTKKNSYYTKNILLANKIFDFEKSFLNENKNIINNRSMNKNESFPEINSKFVRNEKLVLEVKNKNKKFSLNLCSLIKLCLCNKRIFKEDRKLNFYQLSRNFINKCTSVEQFIKQRIQIEFIKSYIFNKNQNWLFNNKKRIILQNELYKLDEEIYETISNKRYQTTDNNSNKDKFDEYFKTISEENNNINNNQIN